MEPQLTIVEVDYATVEPTLRAIRFEVFVDEQNVPPEIEMDDRDPFCTHWLAFDGDEPIATARIDLEKKGKVGRLAVRAGWRRRGVGRALMQRCHQAALAHGLESVWCNAQVDAVPFYQSLGYVATGQVFAEAGIDHLRMTMSLHPDQPAS